MAGPVSVMLSRNKFWVVGLALVVVAAVGIAFVTGERSTGPTSQLTSATSRRPAQPRVTLLSAQRFGAWKLDCIRGPQGNEGCALALFVVDDTREHVLLRLSLVARDGAKILVLTPPNAFLAAGFTLTPDGAHPITAPFQRCLPGSCRALLALSNGDIAALKTAPGVQVHFVTAAGRPIAYHIPTAGFAQGYAAWTAFYSGAKSKAAQINATGQSKPN